MKWQNSGSQWLLTLPHGFFNFTLYLLTPNKFSCTASLIRHYSFSYNVFIWKYGNVWRYNLYQSYSSWLDILWVFLFLETEMIVAVFISRLVKAAVWALTGCSCTYYRVIMYTNFYLLRRLVSSGAFQIFSISSAAPYTHLIITTCLPPSSRILGDDLQQDKLVSSVL